MGQFVWKWNFRRGAQSVASRAGSQHRRPVYRLSKTPKTILGIFQQCTQSYGFLQFHGVRDCDWSQLSKNAEFRSKFWPIHIEFCTKLWSRLHKPFRSLGWSSRRIKRYLSGNLRCEKLHPARVYPIL